MSPLRGEAEGLHRTVGDEFELKIDVFWPGKHVADWEKSRMQVTKLNI